MAVNTRFQQKSDYEVNWNKATNLVPLRGEIIIYEAEAILSEDGIITPKTGVTIPSDRSFYYTFPRTKIGDGVTKIGLLPFSVTTEIDSMVFIAIEDIDAICNSTIKYANGTVTF